MPDFLIPKVLSVAALGFYVIVAVRFLVELARKRK